jgi:hypothetical protein
MRVNYPSRASSLPIDRDPNPIIAFYNQTGIAPHSDTLRCTIAVPSGRLFELDGVYVQMVRNEVATTPGRFDVSVLLRPTGGTGYYVFRWTETFADLFDGIRFHIPGPLYLPEGAVLELYTADYSTGGSSAITACMYGYTFARV